MGLFGIHSSYTLKKGEIAEVICNDCKWEGLEKCLVTICEDNFSDDLACPACNRTNWDYIDKTRIKIQ